MILIVMAVLSTAFPVHAMREQATALRVKFSQASTKLEKVPKYSLFRSYCQSHYRMIHHELVQHVLKRKKVLPGAVEVVVDQLLKELAVSQPDLPHISIDAMREAILIAGQRTKAVLIKKCPHDSTLQQLVPVLCSILEDDKEIIKKLVDQSVFAYKASIYKRPPLSEPPWREDSIMVAWYYLFIALSCMGTVMGVSYALR